jgi:hypothetical protein
MTHRHRFFWAARRGLLALLCIVGATLLQPDALQAAARPDLFQAPTPLADRSEAGYTAAFQTALKGVLVKVTGRRSVDGDPALAPLIAEARRYVQQFHPTADGQILVAFDGTALERWLAQNGLPIWGRDRPVTFVWLGVQSGAPDGGTIVTRDDASELKSLIDAEAAARAVPLAWPTAADLQSNHIDYAALGTMPPTALADIAHRLGGEGVLVGHATGANAAATVRWTHVYQDRSSEFSGLLEGVDRAADTYAGLFAASGSFVPVDIEVDGISDVKDYASVETYLGTLALISHVDVQSLSGDTVRFHLSARGGLEPLERAFALNGLLTPAPAGENGLQRFQLRR